MSSRWCPTRRSPPTTDAHGQAVAVEVRHSRLLLPRRPRRGRRCSRRAQISPAGASCDASCEVGARAGAPGTAALIRDLGKPSRFLNMLRVAKPTSPMSVGTWVLVAYTPAAMVAAGSAANAPPPPARRARHHRRGVARPRSRVVHRRAHRRTAVPAWHDAHREMPYLFAASGAAAAAGLSMFVAPIAEAGPVRRVAVIRPRATRRAHASSRRASAWWPSPTRRARAASTCGPRRAATASSAAAGVLLGGRSRLVARLAGLGLVAGSYCTKMGVFEAGLASAADPRYTVQPQRERLERVTSAPPGA